MKPTPELMAFMKRLGLIDSDPEAYVVKDDSDGAAEVIFESNRSSLYFVKPGKLNFALFRSGRCCHPEEASVPFSALKKPFLKPGAAKYLFPERE
jgi:hypothetical protein